MGLTYSGATAGTTLANPPAVLDSVIGGQFPNSPGLTGGKLWLYSSTNDITDLSGTLNSINDGVAIGAKGGDVLIMVSGTAGSTSPKVQLGVFVTSASATGFAISTNIISSTAV